MSQMRIEAPPAKLSVVTTVAEFAIDNEGDDFGTGIHNGCEVVCLAGLDQVGVAIPSAFGSAIVEDDFDGVSWGGLQSKSLAVFEAVVEEDLMGVV